MQQEQYAVQYTYTNTVLEVQNTYTNTVAAVYSTVHIHEYCSSSVQVMFWSIRQIYILHLQHQANWVADWPLIHKNAVSVHRIVALVED